MSTVTSPVWAFRPRAVADWRFVAEDDADLREKDGEETPADQCDECGSVQYTVRVSRATVSCDECGTEYKLRRINGDEVAR